MQIDESKLLAEANWRSLSEIPQFPVRTFAELRQAVQDGRYFLSVDQTAGHRLIHLTRGPGALYLNMALSWVPALSGIICVAAALVTGRWGVLLGVPVALVTFFMANPINPLHRLMTWLAMLALPVFVYALLSDHGTLAWASGVFMASFHSVRAYYARGTQALQEAALSSEALFLWAYSKNLCGLRERSTGKLIANWRTSV